MTTTLSKIMAVFVTISCVAFMAVIMANVAAGGPNWTARARELKDVAFDRAGPEAPWTAKKRTDGTDLGGGPILPAAIVKVQKTLTDAERARQAELDQKITRVKGQLTESKTMIDLDLDAIKRRQAELDTQYTALQADMAKVSQDYTTEAKKQTEDLAILKLRAQEFILIKNQLEELRAQREVATEEQARLKALLYQARANLERAKTRRQLLESDGATVE